MPTTHTDLGRVQVVYRGEYDPTETYHVLDRVDVGHNTFECRVSSTIGVEPVDGGNDTWLQISGTARGEDGYSPQVTVNKSGDETVITVTDKNGTTRAIVKDGTSVSAEDQVFVQTLDYSKKVKLSNTPNSTYEITSAGALLFHNPSNAANRYNLVMFNSELYDNEYNKLLDLKYNINTGTTAVFVYNGLIYRCVDWNVYEHFSDPEQEEGTLVSAGDTDVAMYFVPFKILNASTSAGGSISFSGNSSGVTCETDFAQLYDTALGDISKLDSLQEYNSMNALNFIYNE